MKEYMNANVIQRKKDLARQTLVKNAAEEKNRNYQILTEA